MREVRLDCTCVKSRGDLHREVALAFGFPEGYGRNLDALFDCLCECPYTIVVLKGEQALSGLGAYGRAFLDVLSDAAAKVPGFSLSRDEE